MAIGIHISEKSKMIITNDKTTDIIVISGEGEDRMEVVVDTGNALFIDGFQGDITIKDAVTNNETPGNEDDPIPEYPANPDPDPDKGNEEEGSTIEPGETTDPEENTTPEEKTKPEENTNLEQTTEPEEGTDP